MMRQLERFTGAVTAILELSERVRRLAAPRGPGWSVAVRDEDSTLIAEFPLHSFDQVCLFADGMAEMGYDMIILDDSADFVFEAGQPRAN